MNRVVVIGGGIAGLSTAYFLAKKRLKPVVIENENETGGLGRCHKVKGILIDSGYHIIFKGDKHLLGLLKELDLEKDTVWGNLDFNLITVNGDISFSPLKILSSKSLSIPEKRKLAKVYFKLKNLKDWKSLDKFTAKEWITRNSNIEIYEKIFEPIIKAKWGRESEGTSAAWFYGRIKPRSESRNIFWGKEKGGYLKGSFRKLFSALEREITKKGGKIITSANIRKISIKGNKVESVKYKIKGNLREIKTDSVISTIPVQELLKTAKLADDFEKKIKRIRYKAVICATYGLKRGLTKSFRTIFSEKKSFGGLVEMTNLIDKKHLGNNHVLYVFNFLDTSEKLWKLKDKKIIETYTNDLEKLHPGFRKLVIWSRLYKNRYGEPFYQKDYLKIMPDVRTPVSGLFITGMVQSYPISDFNNIIDLAYRTSDLVYREVTC
ncbi:MAG: FAD-dependent oxidoreductase [Candidatus Aenigmarchaeota archaeon]|nr:FAD-dependent oxidoreductase [Candidatus Aenigmarchaeota archaeon]